jgi:hypothetical protein
LPALRKKENCIYFIFTRRGAIIAQQFFARL